MKIKYEIYTLKNGMQVLLIPSKTTYSATVSAMIKYGSVQEDEKTQGITHFVEHMALNTTKKWPTKEIRNEVVEFNGASFNGSTGKEILKYYINVPYNKVEFGLDFIYQVLYEALFDDVNIEQERSVILDEISKYEDSVDYRNSRFLIETTLKNKKNYAYETLGKSYTVSKFTKDELKKHYIRAHSPNKILLTVSGNFTKSTVKKEIDKLFKKVPRVEEMFNIPDEQLIPSLVAAKPDHKTDLVMTSVDFECPSAPQMGTREYLEFDLMIKILCGPMSSRLKKRLRDKEGLLYSISAGIGQNEKYGYIDISFEIPPKLFEKAFKILLEELKKFKDKGVSEKELEHYKEYLVNRNLIYYDDFHSNINLIRNPVFWNQDIVLLEDMNKYIRALSIGKINKYIQKYFDFEKMCALAYGNVSDETKNTMEKAIKEL